MRAAELVGRAEQHVAAELGHVDRLVRGVVDRIDPGERAGLAREPADPLGVRDRAGGVRGEGERHHARPLAELALEVVVVDGQLVGGGGDANGQPAVGRELDPRGDAAVVVELRRQDLVTGAKSRPAARVSAKFSVVMFIPKAISAGVAPRNRAASAFDPSRIASTARPVAYGAPRFPEASRSAARDRVADLVGDLGSTRSVEEREARAER